MVAGWRDCRECMVIPAGLVFCSDFTRFPFKLLNMERFQGAWVDWLLKCFALGSVMIPGQTSCSAGCLLLPSSSWC